MTSESEGESDAQIAECQNPTCKAKGPKEEFFGQGKYFCCRLCTVRYSMEYGETVSRDQNRNDEPADDIEEKKSSLKNSKEKTHVKALSGKRKDQKTTSFLWTRYLAKTDSHAAPVSAFPHAILNEYWDLIQPGMKVETYNLDSYCPVKLFWFAEVQQVEGYKGLLRYLGMEKSGFDFWASLCSHDVHPVGWAASNDLIILPPRSIEKTQRDWKRYIVEKLEGRHTFPKDFESAAEEELKTEGLKVGMHLEIMDNRCVRRTRIATIDKLTGGGRISVKYFGSEETFACHIRSPVAHPMGWSKEVGHDIFEYDDELVNDLKQNAVPSELFNQDPYEVVDHPPFKIGQRLEAVNPTRVNSICTATIKKVLGKGFLMIGIDGPQEPHRDSYYCYHWTSACIQYPGFCQDYNVGPLTDAVGEEVEWEERDYLPKELVERIKNRKTDVNNPMKVGWKLEAVDLMDPKLICPATVKTVCGGLLQLGFDGWGDDFNQFVEWRSADIYPIAWCELVRHPLQAPKESISIPDGKGAKRRRTMKKE